MSKYSIGVDFGTESARGLLVNIKTGEELAVSSFPYKHGVLDEQLPSGTKLPNNWALQVPDDYIAALINVVKKILKASKVDKDDVIGIGIDFTASTVIATDERLEPLCNSKKYEDDPHTYVKLWKHHAAQKYADEINALAIETDQNFLSRYGGKVSSEWMFPKILQVLRESPTTFNETDIFIEAGDWIVSKLVGKIVRSSNTTGFKAMWHHEEGYPSNDFLIKLDSQLNDITSTKLKGKIKKVGERAGFITEEFAYILGLNTNTSVAMNIIDAHAANAAVGAINEGDFVMALGTSTCQMLLSNKEKNIKGIAGYVKDGIIPGFFSYETGQAAVGDSFSWFVDNLVNSEIEKAALQNGRTIFEELEYRSSKINVRDNKLIALDWWNGSRSDLKDSNLSGIIIGLTLKTKPEHIYKALLESTAFGTKLIISNYEKQNIGINKVFACGGLPSKNKLMIQIYADILNKPIFIAKSKENTALGSAIYGALSAGKENGGFENIEDAVTDMSKVNDQIVRPIKENTLEYEKMFKSYVELHDIFGVNNKKIMHNL